MADQANISSILAALAAQRAGGAPAQGSFQAPPPGAPPAGVAQGYPAALQSPTPPANLGSFQLPQPSNSGNLDLSSIKPVSSGTVSIAEAIAKARGIAAEKGLSHESRNGKASNASRDADPRLAARPFQRSRSRSRSPPSRRDNFRDNYNPYREERRDDRRGGPRDHARDRSYSPGPRDRRGGGSTYSPPSGRGYAGRGSRSPPRGGSGDDNSETIQIESSLVGLIIGRQGENLRRVESETGARVQFVTGPEASAASRSCRITGTRQARNDAKNEIQRIIEENGGGRQASLQFDRRGGPHQPALRDGEDSIQIMVPDRTVGLIIGRGGETIRDLQDRSKCHVNIVGESKSVNGLRPVNLIGSAQAAAKAKELIMEIVDSDSKGFSNQSAQKGDQGRGLAASSGQGGGGYGGAGGGNDRLTDTIRVPSEAVGMIIGKGGETIKDMQNMTGCKINVSQSTGLHEVEREIGLIGSRDAIEQAKRAIEEKVDVVRHGNRNQASDPYSDRPMQGPSTTGQSYGQAQNQASPVHGNAAPPGGGDGAADPYAAYGGYHNYVAMWYAAMAQQQQQQQPGQGEQPRPPGTS